MTRILTQKRHSIYLVFSILLSIAATATDQVYIPVGEAKVKKSLLAITDVKHLSAETSAAKSFTRTVKDTIQSDLAFTNFFNLQNSASFIEKASAGLTLDQFKISDWQTIGTEFLIKSGVILTGEQASFEVRVYNVALGKQIFGKKYVASAGESKFLGHTVANDLIESLTGKPGLFLTKLTMVCDKSGAKEIWTMDYDGSNPKQITNHRTHAFAPAWSRTNTKIAYSVYMRNSKNIKNIDLYEVDVAARKSKLLSNRKGINSGAVYAPDNRHIALTMSFLGNPEIFMLDTQNMEVTRLTKSLGFDVDPAFSPDGKKLAFVSTRSGQSHVYMLDIATTNSTRLTFAGRYNATPDWSPTGNKLSFAGDLGTKFDLFIMNPDGTSLERLTKNEGSNEDPRFSPDGNFLVFSSNRTGQKNIYIISTDGQYTRRLTYGLGNCEAPRWSYIIRQ